MRPVEPELRALQRARLVLEFEEHGEKVHDADTGWARIDGSWLHWYGDENDDHWQTWPMHAVVCIEWARGAVGPDA